MFSALPSGFHHFPLVVLHGLDGELVRGVQQMDHGVVRAPLGVVLLRVPHVGQHEVSVEQQREVPLLLRADLALASGLGDGDQRRNVQDGRDARVFFANANAVRVETVLQSADLRVKRALIDAPGRVAVREEEEVSTNGRAVRRESTVLRLHR